MFHTNRETDFEVKLFYSQKKILKKTLHSKSGRVIGNFIQMSSVELKNNNNTVRYSWQQSYLLSLHLIHLMLMSTVTSFPAPFQFDPYSLPTSPPSSHANSISDTHAERPSENTITFPHKKVSSGRPGQHGLPANLQGLHRSLGDYVSPAGNILYQRCTLMNIYGNELWVLGVFGVFFISMSCSPANSNLA